MSNSPLRLAAGFDFAGILIALLGIPPLMEFCVSSMSTVCLPRSPSSLGVDCINLVNDDVIPSSGLAVVGVGVYLGVDV